MTVFAAIFSPVFALLDMLGGSELLVIFLLVLIFFGGEKMPEFARGLGKVIREFRKAASGVEQEFKKALEEEPNPARPVYQQPTPTIMPPAGAVPVSKEAGFEPSAPPADAVTAPPAPSAPPAPTDAPSAETPAPQPSSPTTPAVPAAPASTPTPPRSGAEVDAG